MTTRLDKLYQAILSAKTRAKTYESWLFCLLDELAHFKAAGETPPYDLLCKIGNDAMDILAEMERVIPEDSRDIQNTLKEDI